MPITKSETTSGLHAADGVGNADPILATPRPRFASA